MLAQGAEGIAVGLSSKILPHNFVEICDAAVAYLHDKDFTLYPDFPTGGSIDVERYNDGERGGSIKVRAKIEKRDNKTLAITELPYGKTTETLIDSILKAIEKGKIKARKVDDNTAAQVEILVHLAPGTSSDKTLDALYAFSDCEVNLYPNCCVIDNNKPVFLSVKDVLRHSVDNTKNLIRRELEIRKGELLDQLHFCSLEKIFIEERIYKDKKFEEAPDMNKVCDHIASRLKPFTEIFVREVTRDDILRLMEIKMARILKFNKEKADELIAKIKEEIEAIDRDLANMIEVTSKWFKYLKEKYGKDMERKTEIKSFETIEATRVVEKNEKLYINRAEGFIGTSLKKDEFVCNCSDIDDIILFYRDGTYKIIKVSDKIFVGKNVIYLNVFKKKDRRTIYNVVYRDGKQGAHYIKRFNVTGITRDKEYNLTRKTPGSRVQYFSANPNGEAEIIKVTLEPNIKLKNIFIEKDFSEILIKGRDAKGNLLTKNPVHKIGLKSKGFSTLGGRKVWYDPDVNRLNYDEQGRLLGEFEEDDSILVVLKNGEFYTTDYSASNHFEDNIMIIEKWNPDKVWTAVLYDYDNSGFIYIKRFKMEATSRHQNYLGDNPDNKLIILTEQLYPRLKLTPGGADAFRDPEIIDVDEFIAVKGWGAKGKRLSKRELEKVEELEPLRIPEPEPSEEVLTDEDNAENLDPDSDKSQQDVIDEITGQLKLFSDDKDK